MTEYAFFTWGRQVEKRDGSNVGESQHLPPTVMVSYTIPYCSGIVLPNWPEGLGGKAKGPPQHHFLIGTS